VYTSDTEEKRCYHKCKSRFCPSCGYRATLRWLEEQEAALPDIPYAGIVLTMPREPTRYGVSVGIMVVPHTFGGDLKFNAHLHVLVSSGGLLESENRWMPRLQFNKN